MKVCKNLLEEVDKKPLQKTIRQLEDSEDPELNLQIMEGNLTETFTKNVADIAHVQIGEVPGRHEPGSGEVDYGYFLAAIDRS